MKLKLNLIIIALMIISGYIIPAQAGQVIEQGNNITFGMWISPYEMTGYQFALSYDPQYMKLVKFESTKPFLLKQTYFGNVTSSNTVTVFEFIIGNSSVNVSGNLVDFTFQAISPVASTDIMLTQWLISDVNGAVDRSFAGPVVYNSYQIVPNPQNVPITYAGLMTLVSHIADPLYDQTGDGLTDLEDFVKISRQLS